MDLKKYNYYDSMTSTQLYVAKIKRELQISKMKLNKKIKQIFN
jgi:hypothetical protein